MLKHSSSPGTTAPPQAGCAVLSPPQCKRTSKSICYTCTFVVFSFFFLVFFIWWGSLGTLQQVRLVVGFQLVPVGASVKFIHFDTSDTLMSFCLK